jgi:dihydroorotate dehydrogenase electron transfer subunit
MRVEAKILEKKGVKASSGQPFHVILRLWAPDIARAALPGQFVMVRSSSGIDPILPRPFSIMDAGRDEISLFIRVVGKGTLQLSKLRKNDSILIWGPLGRGFDLTLQQPLLLGGGIGLAPLTFAANELVKKGIDVSFFQGDRAVSVIKALLREASSRLGHEKQSILFLQRSFITSGQMAPPIDRIYKYKNITPKQMPTSFTTVAISGSTIDGSYGRKGFVTDLFKESLEYSSTKYDGVLACGPMGMLKAVAGICADRAIPCQVSLEAPMACGVGACQGCAIPVPGGGYARACQEGPVFKAQDVDWGRL